jgi:hypothetical protein
MTDKPAPPNQPKPPYVLPPNCRVIEGGPIIAIVGAGVRSSRRSRR